MQSPSTAGTEGREVGSNGQAGQGQQTTEQQQQGSSKEGEELDRAFGAIPIR